MTVHEVEKQVLTRYLSRYMDRI